MFSKGDGDNPWLKFQLIFFCNDQCTNKNKKKKVQTSESLFIDDNSKPKLPQKKKILLWTLVCECVVVCRLFLLETK